MIRQLSHVAALYSLCICFTIAHAQPLEFEPIASVSVGGRPESVIGDDNFLYASNFGATGGREAKDGNGYISQISYDGRVLDRNFITLPGGLDGPTGMAILGDRLFVADIDEVIGFDLSGDAAPVRINLSQFRVSFLNDLVAVSNNHLVVSATNARRLFMIDISAQSAQPIDLDFSLIPPNGLEYDASTRELYVAANRQHTIGSNNLNGEILKLNLDVAGSSATLEDRVLGAGRFLDGIELLGDGSLIYSDWVSFSSASGKLGRIDLNDFSLAEPSNLNLRGFSDFHWQQNRRILGAPDLIGGRVNVLQLVVPEPSTTGLLALATLAVPLVRQFGVQAK